MSRMHNANAIDSVLEGHGLNTSARKGMNMIIQKEKCGCFVGRYKGLELHEQSFAAVIRRAFAILTGKEIDPRDIPL